MQAGEPPVPVTDSAIAMFQRHLKMGTPFAPGQRERLLAFHARLPQSAVRAGFDWLPLADMRGRYVGDLDLLGRWPGSRSWARRWPPSRQSRARAPFGQVEVAERARPAGRALCRIPNLTASAVEVDLFHDLERGGPQLGQLGQVHTVGREGAPAVDQR